MKLCTVAGILFITAAAATASAQDTQVIKQNGGWCWFQDDRAIVDGGKVIFGSVAGTTARGSDAGDVQVSAWDPETGETESFTLHPRFESDDHDAPAILRLPDGRYLAVWAAHGGRDTMHWRISEEPGDISAWSPEQTQSVGAGATYSNVYQLSEEDNRIYNFHRGVGFNPNYMFSDDNAETFEYGGRLLQWTVKTPDQDPKAADLRGGGRPYVRYASNGEDEVHFITTEDHPRNYDNSIYHGYMRAGKIYRSDGTVAGPLSETKSSEVSPTDLSLVFEGDADNVAWTIDVELDDAGRPFALFSVQRGGGDVKNVSDAGGEDHRYYYARWDGEQWRPHEIAYAGSNLYGSERDYTGLGALNPDNPNQVFISADVDPDTGEPLISAADDHRHYEIFEGRTEDGGKSWNWTAVTEDSTQDNIRPIIPRWNKERTAVLWERGTYRSYRDYDMDIVGMVVE